MSDTGMETWSPEDRTTFKMWTVAAYEVTRCYGGPEEGGWWYDAGDLVCSQTVLDYDVAVALANEWSETEFPFTRKRYSVLGGDDYDVIIIDGAKVPESFPERIPFYE